MADAPHLQRDGRSYADDLRKDGSGIFSISDIDMISENQK
jgi:hypothetical protein